MMELSKEPPGKTDIGYQEPNDESPVTGEDPEENRTAVTCNVPVIETKLSKEPLDKTTGPQVPVYRSRGKEVDPEFSRQVWAEVEAYCAALERAAEGDTEQ